MQIVVDFQSFCGEILLPRKEKKSTFFKNKNFQVSPNVLCGFGRRSIKSFESSDAIQWKSTVRISDVWKCFGFTMCVHLSRGQCFHGVCELHLFDVCIRKTLLFEMIGNIEKLIDASKTIKYNVTFSMDRIGFNFIRKLEIVSFSRM